MLFLTVALIMIKTLPGVADPPSLDIDLQVRVPYYLRTRMTLEIVYPSDTVFLDHQ